MNYDNKLSIINNADKYILFVFQQDKFITLCLNFIGKEVKTMKTVKRMSAIFLSLLLLISFSTITAEASSLPKASITSITAYPCGFKAYFKKQNKITGYQIQYSTASNFKNAKYVKTTNTSSAIRNLSSKKKYYVRVRTYKKSNKKYTYSSWSSSRTIKTLNKNAPNPAHIKTITPVTKGFNVTIYKSSNATGYQVRYSTKNNLSGYKTTTVKGSKNTTIKVTGKAENQKYYVQSRTYKVVNGKTYYSNWSPTKSIKTPTHKHNYSIPVYTTEKVLVTPAYDEPVYEEIPIYETQTTYEWEKHAFCYGCHIDCTIECRKYGISVGAFQMGHCTGYDPNIPTCPKTYSEDDSHYYYDYVQVPTGTEQIQIGTEKVQTGTIHHDAVYENKKIIIAYKCSCGATKSA